MITKDQASDLDSLIKSANQRDLELQVATNSSNEARRKLAMFIYELQKQPAGITTVPQRGTSNQIPFTPPVWIGNRPA